MFKVSYFLEVLPIIASKVNITFELTIAATIFALIVGVIIAIIGYYKIPVLYQLTRVYVSIMRGTPVVAQLYFFYYGIALYSAFVRNMTPLIAVAVVMSFNMGAFMSESIRGALLSVDEGQKEAAYSLGMTNFQLVTRIVIPQAVRVALPPLFNDIINLIKMTSLAFMLGVPDIMGAAKIEGARTFRYFEIYAVVLLQLYLRLCSVFSSDDFSSAHCSLCTCGEYSGTDRKRFLQLLHELPVCVSYREKSTYCVSVFRVGSICIIYEQYHSGNINTDFRISGISCKTDDRMCAVSP